MYLVTFHHQYKETSEVFKFNTFRTRGQVTDFSFQTFLRVKLVSEQDWCAEHYQYGVFSGLLSDRDTTVTPAGREETRRLRKSKIGH